MTSTVNVAMIGLGFGAEFIPIYQALPNVNQIAICRRDEAEMNKVGDQFGIEKRYTNYDDVLADPEIDFVHINSPIGDHAWMSLKALDAGKHVMCTVPMATTIEECQQKRADMTAVHIGICHYDDLVIARLLDIEIFGSYPRAARVL